MCFCVFGSSDDMRSSCKNFQFRLQVHAADDQEGHDPVVRTFSFACDFAFKFMLPMTMNDMRSSCKNCQFRSLAYAISFCRFPI